MKIKTLAQGAYAELIIHQFFRRARIQKYLRFFADSEITAWEKWFQLELCYFLDSRDDEPEWWIENTLAYYRRMENSSRTLRPDVLVRKKGWKVDSYAVIELKHSNAFTTCINAMVKDLSRLWKARNSELVMRSWLTVGVYARQPKQRVLAHIAKALERADWEPSDFTFTAVTVPNTAYGYALIRYE